MNEQKYMWSYAGTALLISIWSQSSVQRQLKATLRNQGIWDGLARYMCRRGFNVNGRQCRTRIKNILVRYRDAKKSGNISGTGIEPYYHDLDRVMTLRDTQGSPSALPHVPSGPSSQKDPLESPEHKPDFEGIRLSDASNIYEVNVKSELQVPSNASEEDSLDTSHDFTPSRTYFRSHDGPMDEDHSSSSTHVISSERVHSPILNAADKCEVIAVNSPPPTPTECNGPFLSYPRGGSSLEQLVVRAIESQTDAVTKVLTAQHNLAKQLLEADRERQMRLEYKLDNIIERLERFIPPVTLPSSRTLNDYSNEEKHNNLNRLLDRLEQVLPLISSTVTPPKQKVVEKLKDDKVERILNRLDQLLSSSSCKLNDDD